MFTLEQVKQLKKHAKEAVESLPEDTPWIHYLGSLDLLCDTALELFASQPIHAADNEKVATESATQPEIEFCSECGTVLGCR